MVTCTIAMLTEAGSNTNIADIARAVEAVKQHSSSSSTYIAAAPEQRRNSGRSSRSSLEPQYLNDVFLRAKGSPDGAKVGRQPKYVIDHVLTAFRIVY